MRQHATKERRRERYEFVYKYRRELEELETANANETKQFINHIARIELNYSSNTYYFDIYMSLKRDFIKLFNIEL
ncbi:MAG: hypothetical protein QM802_20135 [Agriterribacter sp.]